MSTTTPTTDARPVAPLSGPGPANRLAPGFDALVIDAAAEHCTTREALELTRTLTRTAWPCWGPPEVTTGEDARIWLQARQHAGQPLQWLPLPVSATGDLAQGLAALGRQHRAQGLYVSAEDCRDLAEWIRTGRLTVWSLEVIR